MTKKLKLLTALVTITAMCWAVAKPASAHGSGERDDFKLFFGAKLVTGGIPPHEVAVELTSNCGAQPYSAGCSNTTCTPPWVCSVLAFIPDKNSMTLTQITDLMTDYNVNGTDCTLGSPRIVIFTSGPDFWTVNMGQPPFGGGCYYGWQNTGNLASLNDTTARWAFQNGSSFSTWKTLVTLHGTEVVTEVDIILDAGYAAPRGQDVMIDNFTVNKEVMNFSEEHHDH